jgi:hypothetical protein
MLEYQWLVRTRPWLQPGGLLVWVVTDITTVDTIGQVTSYKGIELEQFLQKWITHLTGIVAQDYPPAYQFDMNG